MPLRTPLYDWHVAHGGRMVEFGGWDMPVQYSTIVEEHTAVRTAVGLFDISHMGRLSFGGSGALDLLQYINSNNIATMKDFQVRYGLVLNDQGGIRDDVLVYRWPYGYAMVVNASNRTKIVGWLEQHKVGRDVQLMDQTTSTCMVAVQGPRALELVSGLVPDDLGALPYYYARPTRCRKQNCVVSRTGYTGEDGVEFMVPAALGVTLWEELVGRGGKPCGLGARDTLRLEAAMPLYGHELSEEIDPLQAGLGWAVKLDKGAFLGQEALRRRQQDTTRRVRIGLELEGKRIAREGAAVLARGAVIGQVTSGTFSPTLEKALAMAYVAPDHTAVGSPCTVDVRGKEAVARVVPLPFYRRGESVESIWEDKRSPRDPVYKYPKVRWLSHPQTKRETPMDPQKLRYAKTHEWAYLEGDLCTVGLTQYAVEQLTDVIYIELPDLGDPVIAGDGFGEIESVKSVNDLYAPITGDVIEVNTKLETDPSIVSKDPYGKGWLIKVKVEKKANLDHLMTKEQYDKQIASESH